MKAEQNPPRQCLKRKRPLSISLNSSFMVETPSSSETVSPPGATSNLSKIRTRQKANTLEQDLGCTQLSIIKQIFSQAEEYLEKSEQQFSSIGPSGDAKKRKTVKFTPSQKTVEAITRLIVHDKIDSSKFTIISILDNF